MRIQVSSAFKDASGRSSKLTVLKGRTTTIARSHVKPIDPKSSEQLKSRNLFSNLSKIWATLDQSQQDAWINCTLSINHHPEINQRYFSSGFTLFKSVNLYANYFKLTNLILTPPTFEKPHIYGDIYNCFTPQCPTINNMTIYFPPVDRNECIMLLCTPSLPTGCNSFENKYKPIFIHYGPDSGFFDNYYLQYISVFGSLVGGSKISYRAIYYNPLGANPIKFWSGPDHPGIVIPW